MEKSFPEQPDSIIDDDSLWPDQINGAPPHKPPEKLPEMFFKEKKKQPEKPKQSAGRCEKTGKQKLTRDQAKKQAYWFRRVRHARMHSFQCKSCKHWHIGNSYIRPRRKPKQRGR
tara:strand:+ start:864 stop:1208 length:345 start_codon:yes stop_codon:yes gene_type:complete